MRDVGATEDLSIELVRKLPMLPSKCETHEDRVHYVVQLLAMGEYRRGKTNHELAAAWRLSRSRMAEIITEAYNCARVVVSPTKLITTIDQATEELINIAYRAKESIDIVDGDGKVLGIDQDSLKAAVVAFSKVTEVSLALLKGRENEVEGKWPDTAQKLIAAGWTPPVLEGLPFPNVEDPSKEEEPKE